MAETTLWEQLSAGWVLLCAWGWDSSHTLSSCRVTWWPRDGCPIPGSVQGWTGLGTIWAREKFPCPRQGGGTRWALRSFPTQTTQWTPDGQGTFGEVAPHPELTGQHKESFITDNSQWQENGYALEGFYSGRITPEMCTETGSSTGSSTESSQGVRESILSSGADWAAETPSFKCEDINPIFI